jgi:hypothetical protein
MPAFDAKTATPLAGSKVATDDVFIIGDVSADGFAVVRADNIATAIGVTAANPTATVGLSAVDGSASTFLRSDGAPALSQAIAPTWTAPHIYSPAARASGVAPYFTINAAADTGATASTEHIGISVTGATRQHAAGAITTQREIVIAPPTYSFASASTITNAATVAISGAPVAGTNATLTNSYALWVQGGASNFNGAIFDNNGSRLTFPNNTAQIVVPGTSNMQIGFGNALLFAHQTNNRSGIGPLGQYSMVNSGFIGWSSGAGPDPFASNDIVLSRAAANVVQINNGSSGAGGISSPANSPAQITADQNNYSPGVGMFQRWSSDASRNITGMVAGVAGEIRYVWNVGANDIVLQNENASSTAANRFTNSTGADITVGANKCALCMYDATSSRWRVTLLP